LGREVLRQLRLDDYAEEVLARLEAEASAGKMEESQHRQEEARLSRELQGLRELLGAVAATNPRQARICLDQIEATQEKLADLRAKPLPSPAVRPVDVEWVRRFLAALPERWASGSGSARNRLLKALVERVLVRKEGRSLHATIVWRGGHRESLGIELPPAKHTREGEWSEEELRLLRLLWPGSSREAVLAALPGRTWRGVSAQAFRLKMRRKIMRQPALTAWRPWTPDEDDAVRAMYESGVPVTAIADALGRSMDGIEVRASRLKLERPKPPQTEVYWQVDNHNTVEAGAPAGGPDRQQLFQSHSVVSGFDGLCPHHRKWRWSANRSAVPSHRKPRMFAQPIPAWARLLEHRRGPWGYAAGAARSAGRKRRFFRFRSGPDR
jgi:hypothetical protein